MPVVVQTYIESQRPRSTTFVSPATTSTPARLGGARDRLDLGAQVVRGEALLEHERQRERERPRAGDREVVHRAVDGELADRAARETDRPDDEAVGRAAPGSLDDAGVVERSSADARSAGDEQPLDERLRRLAAGAVRHRDLLVPEARRPRADALDQIRGALLSLAIVDTIRPLPARARTARSCSTPRRRPRRRPCTFRSAAPACRPCRRPCTPTA